MYRGARQVRPLIKLLKRALNKTNPGRHKPAPLMLACICYLHSGLIFHPLQYPKDAFDEHKKRRRYQQQTTCFGDRRFYVLCNYDPCALWE